MKTNKINNTVLQAGSIVRGRFYTGLVAVCMVLFSAMFVAPAQAQDPGTIRAIAVEGVARVEAETVRSYLLVREGDAFDPVRIDRSLKSLFSTGLFADVNLSREGDTLVVRVIENPVINRIAFEGNNRIKDDELMAEISLKPRVIYTRVKVQNDVHRIQTIYQKSGRFAVTVEPKIIQLPQNRVDLVYEIDEGLTTEVQNIRFVGNHVFEDDDLREVIRTRETRWYRFLSSDDTYDPDRVTFDRELLRRFYLQNGYADFQVLSSVAELTPDRSQFFLTFMVEEGQRYKIGDVKVTADLRDLKAEDVSGQIDLHTGEWYDATTVDDTVETLTKVAGNLGYAFVQVRPKVDRDEEHGVVNLDFQIEEGPRVFVERINITGNVRTLDKVIRREFRLVEGDAFNAANLRRSRTRIENLNFFEKVTMTQAPGSSPDKAVVNVEVEEKSTGSLSVGAGYSTGSGALGEISVTEGNLLGRGQKLSLSLRISQRSSQINLGFTEPHFLNRDLSAGFDIYHTKSDYQSSSSYDTETTGGGLRVGYPITNKLRQSWSYTLKSTNVTGVPSDASIYIQQQEGKKLLSMVGHGLFYDARNSKVTPTAGYFVSLKNDLAGLGGDSKYLRNTLSGGYYYKVAEGWVASTRASGGLVVGLGEDVNLLDRFFLGGDTLRGFQDSGVGPRDISTDDALGGEVIYTAGAQLTVPLGLPQELGLSGKVFTDAGSAMTVNPSGTNVVDKGSLRASVGAGIVWGSPVGPISIDFAKAVLKESYDQTEIVRFNFGTQF